jgi:hypothetical protein
VLYHLLLAACLGLAQESEPAPAPQRATDPVEEIHERMRLLLLEIERGLERVDGELWDAGGAVDEERTGAQVGARLARALEGSLRVVDDIDRLLVLADHPHPAGAGGAGT